MASAARILGLRKHAQGSFNKRLAKIAACAAEHAEAQVTYLELRDLALPLSLSGARGQTSEL